MKALRSWIALLLVTAVGLAACAPQGASQPKIVIAVQPTATAEQLSANAKDLGTFLTQKMGREVELVFPTTYAGVVESLRFGHAQAAFMSAWPARLAWKIAEGDVALAEIREVVIGQEKKEETFYFSYWVVPKNSTIDEARGSARKAGRLPEPAVHIWLRRAAGASRSSSASSRSQPAGKRPTRRHSSDR